MISNSAETSRVVHFGREEAMTYEERWNASLQVKFIAYAAGAPSLLSTAFVGIVGLWYAWIFTSDIQTWLAVSAGLLAITFFSAGLPIAWASTRGHNNVVARASFALWLACVAMNFVTMSQFARHVPEAAAPGFYEGPRSLRRRDRKTRRRHRGHTGHPGRFRRRGGGWRTQTQQALTTENGRRHADLQAKLRNLETKRYGAPVTKGAPARAGSAPGLDLAAIALIMIAASAVGLLISAESLAAVMLAKVREGQGAAGRGPGAGSRPLATGAAHPRWRKHRRLRFVDRQMPVACEEWRSAARPRRSLTTRRSARQTTSAPTSTNRTSTPGSPSIWAPSTASPRRTRTARSTGAWRSSMTTKWACSTGMPARSTAMPEPSTDMRGKRWEFGFGRARWTTPPGRSTS